VEYPKSDIFYCGLAGGSILENEHILWLDISMNYFYVIVRHATLEKMVFIWDYKL